MNISVNRSVCLVCCVSDCVCELFGETIRNMFGCDCYFVVECYGAILRCRWSFVGETMNGLPQCVCVVPVVPVRI